MIGRWISSIGTATANSWSCPYRTAISTIRPIQVRSATAQPAIYDPLFQGNASAQTREGLGLGLFIVDQIVSAHGGAITVASSQEEGTIFSVRLPRRSPS